MPKSGASPLDALEADPRFLDLLTPVERRQIGGRHQPGLVNTVLRRTGDTLLVGETKTLTAYDLESGALLWTRSEPCHLQDASGEFAWLSCSPVGSIAVIAARSGRSVLATRSPSYGDDVALEPHALLIRAKSNGTLTSRPLIAPGARSVSLPIERGRATGFSTSAGTWSSRVASSWSSARRARD